MRNLHNITPQLSDRFHAAASWWGKDYKVKVEGDVIYYQRDVLGHHSWHESDWKIVLDRWKKKGSPLFPERLLK